MDKAISQALAEGFSHAGVLNPATIVLKEEVRQMCAACAAYDTRWSCPPGCGTLEQCRERIGRYHQGFLVQTTGQLEDEFDGEAMMETEALHKENFEKLYALLRQRFPDMLALGAGGCRLCSKCSYPDAPCRFPEKMVSSMEAYGMVVTEVCQANGMAYHYGKNTITYTSCFLLG